MKKLISTLSGLAVLLAMPLNIRGTEAEEHYIPGTGIKIETYKETFEFPKIVPGKVLYTHDSEGNRFINPVREYHLEVVPQTRTRVRLGYDKEESLLYRGLQASKNWKSQNPFCKHRLEWVYNENLPENCRRVWGGRFMWVPAKTEMPETKAPYWEGQGNLISPESIPACSAIEYRAPSKIMDSINPNNYQRIVPSTGQPTYAPRESTPVYKTHPANSRTPMIDSPTTNPRNSIYGGDPANFPNPFR